MKRKNIFIGMLFVLTGLLAMQSCSKEEDATITIKKTFSVPVAKSPVNEAVIAAATTADLTWISTGGAEVKWDVYFGETAEPALLQSNYASQTINVPIMAGHTYYWQLKNVDANGIVTISPVFSFAVAKTLVIYNIDDFVGTYQVTEGPAHYTVNMTKVNATTLKSDNFWDSAPSPLWEVEYVFDSYGGVTMTPSSYRTTPTSSTIYRVSGAGSFDIATKTITVDYEVLKTVGTLKIDGTYTVVTTSADAAQDVMVKQ